MGAAALHVLYSQLASNRPRGAIVVNKETPDGRYVGRFHIITSTQRAVSLGEKEDVIASFVLGDDQVLPKGIREIKAALAGWERVRENLRPNETHVGDRVTSQKL